MRPCHRKRGSRGLRTTVPLRDPIVLGRSPRSCVRQDRDRNLSCSGKARPNARRGRALSGSGGVWARLASGSPIGRRRGHDRPYGQRQPVWLSTCGLLNRPRLSGSATGHGRFRPSRGSRFTRFSLHRGGGTLCQCAVRRGFGVRPRETNQQPCRHRTLADSTGRGRPRGLREPHRAESPTRMSSSWTAGGRGRRCAR